MLILFSSSCKKAPHKEVTILKAEVPKEEVIVEPTYNYDKDFILGKFDYKKDSTFIKIDALHSSKTIYLNKEVYLAFKEMYHAAKKEDINLVVISGTRNFNEQKAIWERKWKKYENLPPLDRVKKILEYSSMPTTSRHHWGTDMDLIQLKNSYFENGKGKKAYDWLTKNANNYGFYQVYTNKENGRTGYHLEKWHWSYLPLASKYLKCYNENVTYDDINNFNGSEWAEKAQMISEYVNGISIKAKDFSMD
ncbi:M15 family metallopeptidase [Pseudotamlana agarivorans]|uniref:M15 family metallopeptidase n=1 Tax=Pseudotamlana agarivorans TaxID=481183 RepID=UPI002091DF61|nr:M15 family metallopeptidase [Tamlana agarivorans]